MLQRLEIDIPNTDDSAIRKVARIAIKNGLPCYLLREDRTIIVLNEKMRREMEEFTQEA
jgi:hypothetical protein